MTVRRKLVTDPGDKPLLPSQVEWTPWIAAHAPSGPVWEVSDMDEDDPASTIGKWLLYVPKEHVDEVWRKVAELTEAGQLGPSAKVATAHSNPLSTGSGHVICVYAEDWRDVEDLRRIVSELRRVGLAQGWTFFKRDRETWAGAYGVTGHRGVSVWGARPATGGGQVIISTKWTPTGRPIVVTPGNVAGVVAAIEGFDEASPADP